MIINIGAIHVIKDILSNQAIFHKEFHFYSFPNHITVGKTRKKPSVPSAYLLNLLFKNIGYEGVSSYSKNRKSLIKETM
ncbi:MAG: hypothetical protein FWH29_09380 [Methanobrevibacter sp.]|nr:hypothetical protein [Methanobrevibacter sp.]